MKKIYVILAFSAAVLVACKENKNQEKSTVQAVEVAKADPHAGHNHSANDGHDHSSHAGHNHATENVVPAKEESESAHEDEIIFTKEQAKNVGLEVGVIEPKKFNQIIKTSGQILAAPGDESTIVAPVAGVVSFSKQAATEGANVNKGTSLLSISAKNMSDGDPSVKAKVIYEAALREYERAQKLIKDKIISEKEFNQIKQNYETSHIAYLAVADGQTAKGQSVISPMSGFVKSKLVNEGDYVEVGTPVLVVSQNKRLALRAEVSERNYKDLHNIGSANFKTPYDNKVYELSELNARLLSYGKASGGNSFYIPVTFEFDNKGDIVPGSYVEIYLISKPMEQVLTVPVTALTEEQGFYFVYKQLDDEGYKKQEVSLGVNNGKEVQILSGLKTGDKVVTKGAYQVKLAANGSAIPEGHSHSH